MTKNSNTNNSNQKQDNRIVIFDTTLRDGEQAPGAGMTIPEKVQIAHQLTRLGVDVIEAGFPVSSPAQDESVRRIVSEVEGPVICALARAIKSDVEAAGAALEGGKKTRIHTFIATSDIHLLSKFADDRYGKSIEEKRTSILKMAVEAVELASTYTDDIEFSAEDAGRTSKEFLCEIVQATINAGATTINLPDTTGFCVPEEYAAIIRTVLDNVDELDNVIISTHCHDDLGFAVANSIAGLRAGARQIECTINGIGERAGNAALEEIAMILEVRKELLGLETGINSRLLMETSKMVSTFCGFTVQRNKAIVGENAFSHEAGIHQDGVLKSRETYEIMRAEDVGQSSENIRLGRHSGRHGLYSRLEKLGISVNDQNKDLMYEAFTNLADKKKEINDIDLFNLTNPHATAISTPHYRLDNLDVTVGSGRRPEATVKIRHLRTNLDKEETATGDGPIDALYRAIDHAVSEAHDLVNYSIRSISEGADAFGEVSVLISIGGPCFAGKASHTDVIKASAEAYMNALNSLASFRSDEASVQFVNEGIMSAFQGGEE